MRYVRRLSGVDGLYLYPPQDEGGVHQESGSGDVHRGRPRACEGDVHLAMRCVRRLSGVDCLYPPRDEGGCHACLSLR